MDLSPAWQEITQFQNAGIVTSGHLYAGDQDNASIHKFLEKIPVALLFACLQDASDRGSTEQVKQACNCINRVLGTKSNDTDLFFQPDIMPFILAGLTHVETEARALVLSQFIAHLGRNPSLDQIGVVTHSQVLTQICDMLADEDIEMASKASTVLKMFSRFTGSKLYQAVLDLLKAKVQSREVVENSIEFMRYLETIAMICAQDDEHMEYGISAGSIDLILSCLKSNDPLFLMNVVDLVPAVCQTKVGVEYIFKSGTLKTLLAMKEDSFVGGNAVRLVGEVTATAANLNIDSRYWGDVALSKALLEAVESKIQSADSLQQVAAMDALAAFASSSEKELEFLLQHRSICHLWLRLGNSATMPVKASCYHSLAHVLEKFTRLFKEPDQVPEENAYVWTMCEQLYNSLGVECGQQNTMILLMKSLKQPFEELRTSVFRVLRSVVAQNNPWGIHALHSYGGFFEFLMDRTTEPTKETREWKFSVLDAVLASPYKSLLGTCSIGYCNRRLHFRVVSCIHCTFGELLLSCCRSIAVGKTADEFLSRSLCWNGSFS
ncbi:putative armadillo-like helical, 26S proteasome non-ATPase regulatory subunit 5 [Plasmopara halstedii]